MKKIFLIVAVLMLATPALAVITVDIDAIQGGDTNEVEIWYTVDATVDCEDGNRPRAFGLNISVDKGEIIDINVPFVGECNASDQGYGIFPGTIAISGGEISNLDSPSYTPVAPNDAPGAIDTGLDTNTIVVEMGSLYTGANCPPDSAMLFTITVNMDCNVSVVGNAARTGTASPEGKGVVMENLSEVYELTVNWPSPFHVTGVSRFVPDVVGWEQSAAETEIVDVCDLVVGDISWVCHSSIDYDHVVSTDPEAGTEVEQGTYVDLLKSLGRPHVPDVVNEPNLVAQAAIEDVCGLSVGNVTAECNDVIPAGNVISTNPAYCNYPDCGTAVDIVVSTGECIPEECFPSDHDDYAQWLKAGLELPGVPGPNCWCRDIQCYGDADGVQIVTKTGSWWVSTDDLNILWDGWQLPDGNDGQLFGWPYSVWVCADFDHVEEVTKAGTWRVSTEDLNILFWNWQNDHRVDTIEDPMPNPDYGPLDRADCLTRGH